MPVKFRFPLWLVSAPFLAVYLLAAVFGWGVILGKSGLDIQMLSLILALPLFFWDRKPGQVNRLLIGFACLLFFTAVTANVAEFLNYDNFLFQHFHLDPAGLRTFAGLVTALLVIKFLSGRKRLPAVFLLVILFTVQALTAGLTEVLARSVSRPVYVLSKLNFTSDQKMALKFGPRYTFLMFIKNSLPPGSRLLIPPETAPWLYTGNTNLVKSLLYPVKVLSVTYANKTGITEDFDYILLSSEESLPPRHTWPDFKVPASEIVIYNWDTGIGQIYKDTDYLPETWVSENAWGLIKIRKI